MKIIKITCFLLFITILGSCNTYFKTCTYKKSKNPLSISQIKNMHPVKITIERWADENSLPDDGFVNEIKKEIKTDKSIDDYLDDPNNAKWITEKALEYFNAPNNWIVECEVTDKNQIKLIMATLAKPKEVGSYGVVWTERICFKDDKGKVKWAPLYIMPCEKEVYVGDGHYNDTTTCNMFLKILHIECECRCQRQIQDPNQPSQKSSK